MICVLFIMVQHLIFIALIPLTVTEHCKRSDNSKIVVQTQTYFYIIPLFALFPFPRPLALRSAPVSPHFGHLLTAALHLTRFSALTL